MAHIKRAPIDEPPWKYDVAKLREKSPFAVAQYVAALTVFEHEDEPEAREILAEAGDDTERAILEKAIGCVLALIKQSKLRRASQSGIR
jgi:hypothetical protein